ncbi:hypothetical protein [Corynebacterium sp. HMSC071B10]|uniref:hypothetical protein n=1 Tax=Corynebacterium sp. HMSC071B10 TaxID=1739494 RepID=UPI0008A146E7|nr:hypothetical protein [Corynebacterium sp. HMSC071B10]OFP37419.1 hypothetical protein HMPREF2990_02940 [Corynebacterium sp. HMSC071B10]
MRELVFPTATEVVATRVRVECTPVRVYDKEAKRYTDQQETDGHGRPIWEIEGLAPIIMDAIFEGGKVQVTEFFEPQRVPIGTHFVLAGDNVTARVYPSRGGLGCTMSGDRLTQPKKGGDQQ